MRLSPIRGPTVSLSIGRDDGLKSASVLRHLWNLLSRCGIGCLGLMLGRMLREAGSLAAGISPPVDVFAISLAIQVQ